MLVLWVAGASALAPANVRVGAALRGAATSLPRTSSLRCQTPDPATLYADYMKQRAAGVPDGTEGTRDGSAPAAPQPAVAPERPAGMPTAAFPLPWQSATPPAPIAKDIGATVSDTDFEAYDRVPWWKQDSSYTESQRKDRRTIFMHDDWVRHRSSERFLRNIKSIGSSGINQALKTELSFVTLDALFVVLFNMLFYEYQDFSGVVHPAPLQFLDANIKALSLPALPFTILMPALSLLLVFRTNTAYSRWNEARTLWGGLINNCRNVVRQGNTFFPDDPKHNALKVPNEGAGPWPSSAPPLPPPCPQHSNCAWIAAQLGSAGSRARRPALPRRCATSFAGQRTTSCCCRSSMSSSSLASSSRQGLPS